MGIFGRCVCPMCGGTIAGNAVICPSCGWIVNQAQLQNHTQQAERRAANDWSTQSTINGASMLGHALVRMGPVGAIVLLIIVCVMVYALYINPPEIPSANANSQTSGDPYLDSRPSVESTREGVVFEAPKDETWERYREKGEIRQTTFSYEYYTLANSSHVPINKRMDRKVQRIIDAGYRHVLREDKPVPDHYAGQVRRTDTFEFRIPPNQPPEDDEAWAALREEGRIQTIEAGPYNFLMKPDFNDPRLEVFDAYITSSNKLNKVKLEEIDAILAKGYRFKKHKKQRPISETDGRMVEFVTVFERIKP